jgi:ribosomal protein S18 acetylase RimI-like enzyme
MFVGREETVRRPVTRQNAPVQIRRLGPGDADTVIAASALFDHAPVREATERFLAEPTHHLVMAFDDDGRATGFVSGVETTHPDKGTEMFLYELDVAEDARRQGIGKALVTALRDLARERGCYGMFALTDDDNDAALATYRSTGTRNESAHVMLDWDFRS